jgi:iron complex outermembrane receptor protein
MIIMRSKYSNRVRNRLRGTSLSVLAALAPLTAAHASQPAPATPAAAPAPNGAQFALADRPPLPTDVTSLETVSSSEILVTARRREENAQDVPVALSVVGAKQLEVTGNYSLGQVQQLVPSLQIFSFNPRNTNINIRGFGSNVALTVDGLENGVGVYVDQVYYGRVGASQFDLVDLDHIEVLRGPQGTLFGKNTTAGAINIATKAPTFTPEFTGEATLGDYDYHQVRGSTSGPITDTVAARLSIADTHRDGFVYDTTTGKHAQDYDNFSVRGQVLAKPTDSLSFRFIGDFQRQRLNCCINLPVSVFSTYDNGTPIANNFNDRITRAGYTLPTVDAFDRRTDANSPFHAFMYSWGLSGQIDWDVGPAAITSVTAYRHWHWDPANDSDNIALPVITEAFQANRQSQWSQELRIASTGTNKVDYVAGVYYFWQIINGFGATAYGPSAPNWFLPTVPSAISNAALNGFRAASTSNPQTHSYAAFAQSTWHVTDRLSLTGGLRYTHEDKDGRYTQSQAGADLSLLPTAAAAAAQAIRNSFNPVLDFTASRHDDSLAGTANISYKVQPDLLLYATYSRGNKSGGLNLTQIPSGVPTTVKPEKVDNYEIGLKSQFFNKKVTANLAGFWVIDRNYQTAITTQTSTTTFVQYIANIPKARSRGFEADLSWTPTALISFSASTAYADATYISYPNGPQQFENPSPITNLSGRPLAGVPKFTYTLNADVAQPIGSLQVYGHADWSHRSSFYTAVSDSRYSLVPGYGLANLRVGIRHPDQRWDLSLWVRNLFDKDYFQTLSPSNIGLVTGLTGDPRTFGATLRTKL